MEEKKIYNENDKIFKQFGSFAPYVATYTNIVLSKYPEAEKDFIERLKKCNYKIRSGQEVSFRSLGLMKEYDAKSITNRTIKVFTNKNSYDVDLQNPDFSKHFEILQKPYKDKKITPEAKWEADAFKVKMIKTLLHELNHLTCRLELEYYKNNKVFLGKDIAKLKNIEGIVEVNCGGGVPRMRKNIKNEITVKKWSGDMFHEGATELFAQTFMRAPQFNELMEQQGLAKHKYPWSYKVMTTIIQIQNFLTDDLFAKCYWAGYEKTADDCKIVNKKLAEFKSVGAVFANARKCGVDKNGVLKDEQTIKAELKALITKLYKEKDAYIALLKRQIKEKDKNNKQAGKAEAFFGKRIEAFCDTESWLMFLLNYMGQFSLEMKQRLVGPIHFEVLKEMKAEKKRQPQESKNLNK